MIGRVNYGGGKIVVTLDATGAWLAAVNGKPDDTLARSLSAQYSDEFDGPEYGSPGVAALKDLAKRTGGELEIGSRPEASGDDLPIY